MNSSFMELQLHADSLEEKSKQLERDLRSQEDEANDKKASALKACAELQLQVPFSEFAAIL